MIRISSAGIQGLATFVARTPEVAAEAAKLAVGDAAEWGRNLSKREMVSAVNLPADALAGRRFRISQRPTTANPEAVISADNNPLGLSRFVVGPGKVGMPGPQTRTLRGGTTTQWPKGGDRGDYAFLIKVGPGKKGSAPAVRAGFGLAIRTTRPMENSREAFKIGKDLYLLFGPSVDQMFGQLMPQIVPRVEAKLQTEFARQYERLIRG